MTAPATRTRTYRTNFGTVTKESHDGGKTWEECHREELPPLPKDRSDSSIPPEPTRCRHREHGVCLVCCNAAVSARREAKVRGAME